MKDVFHVLPASGSGTWLIGLVVAFMLLLAAAFARIAFSTRGAPVELSAEGLRVDAPFYGRLIPWSEISADEARATDLAASPELRPGFRSNGVGLPGYQAGWFTLNNGRRGLLFLTDRSRVAVVPTPGYDLLLSVDDPSAFIAAVRRWSAQAGR
jgi:hypothetical protein